MSPPLVLASGSPRRRELLEQLGIAFSVTVPDVDETPLVDEGPNEYVARIAEAKVVAVQPLVSTEAITIAADTTVSIDGEILGKPGGPESSTAMLRQLSGRTHEVFTGLAVLAPAALGDNAGQTLHLAVVRSEVTMMPMPDADIAWYVATGEPFDKAGAYGIQGLGGRFVASVNGSYQTVVGLPLAQLDELLHQAGTGLTDLALR